MMAAKIKLRAQRRIGELSREIPKAQGTGKKTDIISHSIPENTKSIPKEKVLEQAGITKNEASLNERLAAIPEEKFEEIIAIQHDKERTASRKETLHIASTGTPHVSHNSGENEWYTPAGRGGREWEKGTLRF